MKLYADEPGAGLVRGIEHLGASAVARVEVTAALARKGREAGTDAQELRDTHADFGLDWYGAPGIARRFVVIGAGDALLERAAAIARALPLRAYDAIQLASLETAIGAGVEIEAFACFDRGLREAAAERGHALLPAALGPLNP